MKKTHNQSFPGGRKGSTAVDTIVQVGGGGGGTEGLGFYDEVCVCHCVCACAWVTSGSVNFIYLCIHLFIHSFIPGV